MAETLKFFLKKFLTVCLDILPIIVVIAFFQLFVLKAPFPNLQEALFGVFLVVLGLFIFIQGLETALFPIGEKMANQFAVKGNAFWVIAFGFALGFSTTIAEPALTIIAQKAGKLAADAGAINNEAKSIGNYVLGLRLSVAFSVGLAIALGVLRIIKGWSLVKLIIGGYCFVVFLTYFAPINIIGIAYDSGGITTSTITVPLVAALGIGLATAIRGRSPVLDGFGLIALASLNPVMFVMMYGIAIHGIR